MTSSQDLSVPTIAIDGPVNSGKSALRKSVAKKLGFHSLDSGAIYRSLGVLAIETNTSLEDEDSLVHLAQHLDFKMKDEIILINGVEKTELIRSQQAGFWASMVSKLPNVRSTLLSLQLSMRRYPGLVADGRDMGVIFDTPLRFYLEVTAEERARRKFLELQKKNSAETFASVLRQIQERDHLDTTRIVSPLQKHPYATTIYGDGKTVDELTEEVISHYYSSVIE